jgi:hypothetical protein
MSKYKLLLMLPLVLVLTALGTANAAPLAYTPPSNITVRMYRLNLDGSPWVDQSTGNRALCSYTSTVYGCTAFTGNWTYRYPYGYANPVTVPIETDYLLDVVSQEMGILTSHSIARHAQAIVARSYAYHREHFDSHTGTLTMNNSTEAQVFIPYRWEKWGNQSHFSPNPSNPCHWWQDDFLPPQRAVCAAVNASKNYVTGVNHVYDLPSTPLFGTNAPAFTKYFQDTYNHSPTATLTEPSLVPGTTRPVYPYLVGVVDPVSSHPNVPTVLHRHGMSQNGASRWAYGNMGWQGNLDRWSVTWNSVEQILVHYYTNARVRTQNGNSTIPDGRWNPLKIGWGTANNQPPQMQHGSAYPITVELQNTGTQDWTCNFPSENYALKYRWTRHGNQATGTGQASVCGIARGRASQPLNLTIQNIPNWGPGTYGLHFDVESINGEIRLWSTYTVLVCVGNQPCGEAFLPLIIK